MSRGRPQLATTLEREDVRRLAAKGASVRAIAAAVFGDARYRGRVERILRRPLDGPLPGSEGPVAGDDVEVPAGGEAEALRQLIRRKLAGLDERELSLAEIATLMRIRRELQAAEQLERCNALTRTRV